MALLGCRNTIYNHLVVVVVELCCIECLIVSALYECALVVTVTCDCNVHLEGLNILWNLYNALAKTTYILDVVYREETTLNDSYANAADIAVGTPVSDEWVGLGDAKDYYKLDLSGSGTGIYTMKLDNLQNNAKLTVYEFVNGKILEQTVCPIS